MPCKDCGETFDGRAEYHRPRCLRDNEADVVHADGRAMRTRLPLVVQWHGHIAYFCLCSRCASCYWRQQRDRGRDEFRFVSFETKLELRAHVLKEGAYWMSAEDVSDMGVTLPALYWDFKSAYRCRDRIMSPVNSDGGTGAETFGELVFAQRPLAQERAVTASPEVCSSCLMVNPGPCSHHAAYCLDRRRCMLPRGDGIDAVVEVPLAVMGGHIYFFCLCSSCASHSQRAAHGGPRRAPFGTRSLVDLRQHMQEEFSTWLSEDVWKGHELCTPELFYNLELANARLVSGA